MLNPDDNDFICRVGPGTAMNQMLKRYWLPVLTEREVPEPDGAPLHLKLLGENYVFFCDSDGRIGLIDEACCHRGASLALGRVEECGIRCIYHGWKFDVDGNVVDTPNIPDDRIKRRLKIGAYKVQRSGGIVWAYLGPKEKEPPLPHFPYMDLPETNYTTLRSTWPCNWVQAMEGSIDSSHFGFLHAGAAENLDKGAESIPGFMRKPQILSSDNAPVLKINDTDFGFHYVALRKLDAGREGHGARITSCMFPNGFVVPPGTQTLFYVPHDDYSVSWVMVCWDPDGPVGYEEAAELYGISDPRYTDEKGNFNLTPENRFGQDRAMMTGPNWTYSGLKGIITEDVAVVASMGPIVDRRVENLVSSDIAIVRLRQLLMESARRVMRGEDPLCVSAPGAYYASSMDVFVGPGENWQDKVPKHTEVEDLRTYMRAAE